MKKLKAVFALCAMMLVLCGCSMKTEYDMTINKDKSMDFSAILAMDDELIEGMLSMQNQDGEQKEYTDEEIWTFLESTINTEGNPEEKGFKLTKYEEGTYKGYKYSKNISNIDDISGSTATFKLEEMENISDTVVFVKDGNKYKASFVLSSEEQSSSTQGYDVGIEMKFVVTLPNKPISHNATEVSEDGKTLTWNLLNSSSQNIEFEFSFDNNNILLYVGIGAIAFVLIVGIIAVIVMISSKNKKGGNNNVNTPIDTLETTQPEITPIQPVMEQTQTTPVQPTISQPQEMPSVADIMGLTNLNNTEDKNQ